MVTLQNCALSLIRPALAKTAQGLEFRFQILIMEKNCDGCKKISEEKMRVRSAKRYLNLTLLLILAGACQTQAVTPVPSPEQTLKALALTLTAQVPVTETPPGPVQNPSSAPSGGPAVIVNTETKCFSGPGESYEPVSKVVPGATFDLVGKYAPDYWVALTDESKTCW